MGKLDLIETDILYALTLCIEKILRIGHFERSSIPILLAMKRIFN
jgi:hypothetical protein